ncbi:MAG: type II CAAX endopeptidase family protein [Terracidiphilus sp.]
MPAETVLEKPANRQTQPVTWQTLAGLAGALIFALTPLARWLAPGEAMGAMLTREAVWWACAAAILVWLRFGEGLPLSSIGFRRFTWKSLVFGLLAAIATTAIMILQFAMIIPMLHLDASAAIAAQQSILRTPYWFRVLLVLRTGVVEEILFRGYLIEKIVQVAGSLWIAILCSAAAFTYAHLAGWGLVHLIPVAGAGLVFALLYAWRRDLGSNMLGHFIADGLGFLTR